MSKVQVVDTQWLSDHKTLPHEIHHVGDSSCEDTFRHPTEDISNDIQKRIDLVLLKLENVHNVSAKCSDDLVEKLHFISNVCLSNFNILTKLSEELCSVLSHFPQKGLGLDGPFRSVHTRRNMLSQ